MQNGEQLHLPTGIYRGSTCPGADTEEMLSTASQQWGWAAELGSGCWDVERNQIGQKLGYSWVFWEGGKELARSFFVSDTGTVAVSPSQGSLWTNWGSRQANRAAAKQVRQQPVEGRRNVLNTPLAQILLWDAWQSSQVTAVTQGACLLVNMLMYLLKWFELISWKVLVKMLNNSHPKSQRNWISHLS